MKLLRIVAVEVTEDEFELDFPEQEFTSKKTSINKDKLPAIYGLVNFPKGSIVLDYGGGKFDNGLEYLETKGCTGYVYDPFNRDAAHNRKVLAEIRKNGGADITLCSNVLNVIKEPEVRLSVLKNIKRLTKPSGKVYILVYEGDRSGVGRQSQKDAYQLNKKTEFYLEEVQEVFPQATRKGKLILASSRSRRSQRIYASNFWDEDTPEEADFDRKWDKKFGEPTTEVFTQDEF